MHTNPAGSVTVAYERLWHYAPRIWQSASFQYLPVRVIRRIVIPQRLLLLILLLLTAAQAGAVTETSEAAPLANQSLLLDITHAGDRLVSVGERGHILLSDDQGRTWRQSIAPTRSQLTSIYFIDEKNGWAGGHDGIILHSGDSGENWSVQHRDAQYDDPVLDIWFRNDQEGFAIGAYGMFLSTSNGGKSWDRRTIIDDDFHFNAMTTLADGELFIAAEQGHVYHSRDGGYSWHELPSPYSGSFFGITTIGNDELLIYGLRGHLYRSTDRGQNWLEIDSGTEASLVHATQTADGQIYVVGLGGNILSSEDNGTHFRLRTREDRKTLTAVISNTRDELVISGAAGISIEDRKH